MQCAFWWSGLVFMHHPARVPGLRTWKMGANLGIQFKLTCSLWESWKSPFFSCSSPELKSQWLSQKFGYFCRSINSGSEFSRTFSTFSGSEKWTAWVRGLNAYAPRRRVLGCSLAMRFLLLPPPPKETEKHVLYALHIVMLKGSFWPDWIFRAHFRTPLMM